MPDVFGGVFLTDKASHIDVYVTKLNEGTQQALLRRVDIPVDEVTFRLTTTTESELNELHAAVTAANDQVSKAGVRMSSWYADVRSGHEVIRLIEPTPDHVALIRKRFGPKVEVQAIPLSAAPRVAARENDSSPWNGGDFTTTILDSGYVNDCTTGIPVHNPGGAEYILTAAHCSVDPRTGSNGAGNASTGSEVHNYANGLAMGTFNQIGFISNSGLSYLGYQPYGAGSYPTFQGLDAALISTADSSSLVYTGSSRTPSRSVMSGPIGGPAGAQVCADGAYEGQHCGMVISANSGANFLYFGESNAGAQYVMRANHVMTATSSDSQAVGSGDSGGPVLRYTSSGMYVTGTITGFDSDGRCTNYSVWSPPYPRDCGSTFYYTDIMYELAQWGLIVN